jgi:hypothetical protein
MGVAAGGDALLAGLQLVQLSGAAIMSLVLSRAPVQASPA